MQVILSSLVYEKQQKLRIMMKMHGLGDVPYWMITYAYFVVISLIYMCCYFGFGVLTGNTAQFSCLFHVYTSWFNIFSCFTGLTIFKLNSYGVQCIFYFVFTNLQISMAFLLAAVFSNLKTASGWFQCGSLQKQFTNMSNQLKRGSIFMNNNLNIGCCSCCLYNCLWDGDLGFSPFPAPS